jgi:hypothetical protein
MIVFVFVPGYMYEACGEHDANMLETEDFLDAVGRSLELRYEATPFALYTYVPG